MHSSLPFASYLMLSGITTKYKDGMIGYAGLECGASRGISVWTCTMREFVMGMNQKTSCKVTRRNNAKVNGECD